MYLIDSTGVTMPAEPAEPAEPAHPMATVQFFSIESLPASVDLP